MTAQQKTLVMLLAATLVAGGLGVYAYFGVMKPGQQAQHSEEKDTHLVPGAGEQAQDAGPSPALVFTSLSLRMVVGETTLEPREGTWHVTAPVQALADKAHVDELLGELSHANFKATLEEHPTDADLERYGLKPPQASVTARGYEPDAQGGGAQDPSRQRTVTFELGKNNPFDNSVYVRREGDPHVYLAQGSLLHAVQRPPDAWRDRQVFPVEESALLRIEVHARTNALVLERVTTDKPWQLVRPVKMSADPLRVTRMMSELYSRRALNFPDARREVQVRQALEKPQVEATFVPKTGGPIHVRITELRLPGLPPLVFELCTWDGGSVLAQVDNIVLDLLDVPPQDFKDKTVLAFDLRAVHQVLIRPKGKGEPIKLERAPDTERWEMVSPMVGLVREDKLAALLNGLAQLQAAAIGEVHPKDWGRYGIGEDARGVSLRDGAGEEMARLWVGTPVKSNSQRLWGRGSSGDALELDKAALGALPLTVDELLNEQSAGGRR